MSLFIWLLMKNETVDVGQQEHVKHNLRIMLRFLHLYSSLVYKTIMKWPSVQPLTLQPLTLNTKI